MTYFYCEKCGRQIRTFNEEVGNLVECPGCHVSVTVPGVLLPRVTVLNRPRWTLVQTGFCVGSVTALYGILALYSCLMGERPEVGEIAFYLALAVYGGVLIVGGAATCLLEWNQRFAPPAKPDAVPTVPNWARGFSFLCLIYGWLAGGEFAKPGASWMALGLGFGVITGILGAAGCAMVLDNWTSSIPRRIHACIFISLGSLLFSILASKYLWVVVAHFHFAHGGG